MRKELMRLKIDQLEKLVDYWFKRNNDAQSEMIKHFRAKQTFLRDLFRAANEAKRKARKLAYHEANCHFSDMIEQSRRVEALQSEVERLSDVNNQLNIALRNAEARIEQLEREVQHGQ